MDLVGKAAETFGDLPALRTPDETISFKECDRRARNIAAVLLQKGLNSGDIVAVVSPNTPEMAMLLFGLLKAGLVAAPLNCRFPVQLVAQTVEKLQPKLLLTERENNFPCQGTPTASIQEVIENSRVCNASFTNETERNMELPVSVIHTSASTGFPKAVLHNLSSHWYNALGSNENMPLAPGDCWLLSLPFYHIGGYAVIFRALVSGASMALGNTGESLGESLKRFPVTHLSLVPTQLYRLLADPGAESLSGGMKAVLLGGSPAPESLVEEAAQRKIPLYLSYGSTEMGSQIATTKEPVKGIPPDSGYVLPFREVSEGEDGELLVRGRCLFAGYLIGGKVCPATDADGWFHTSDVGHVSKDGRVTVMGRKDNMFISGGENIHPEEIEKALMTIRGINEALVVPIPDMEYGQRPLAFIQISGEKAPSDDSLGRHMRELVGKLKAPLHYVRVNDWEVLPGSQKIDRGYYRRLALEPPKTEIIAPLQQDA